MTLEHKINESSDLVERLDSQKEYQIKLAVLQDKLSKLSPKDHQTMDLLSQQIKDL